MDNYSPLADWHQETLAVIKQEKRQAQLQEDRELTRLAGIALALLVMAAVTVAYVLRVMP